MLPVIQSSEITKKLIKFQPTTPTEVERLMSTTPSTTSSLDADAETLRDRDGSGDITLC